MGRSRRRRNDPKTTSMALIVVGCVFILLAVIGVVQTVRDSKAFEACTETTEGVVTHVEKIRHTSTKKGRTHHYNTYVTEYYYEVNGMGISASHTLSQGEEVPEGTKIKISYDPNDPAVHSSQFDDNDRVAAVIGLIFFGVIGIVCLVVGIKIRPLPELEKTGMGYGDVGNMKQSEDFTQLN